MIRLCTATFALGALLAVPALADCGIPEGSVRILSNSFSSLTVVGKAAEECASPTVTVTKNQTTEHDKLQGPALTANPAEYTVAIISNSSLTALLNEGLVRPMDDLVAEYGQQLKPNQLIKVDGKVVAIAFMANAQHFFYREDILAKAGVPVPTTYEDVLTAAEAIRAKGLMKYPLAGTYKPDWDLAEEFVNMYFGYGGSFFEPGTAKATINNEKAVKALEMMKALSSYMNPEFMTYDTESIVPIWDAGEVAMANLWGSRASSFLPESSNAPEIAKLTRMAAAPTVGGGTTPATTVWWDGFTIAKNITDVDAEASFRTMMHAVSIDMAKANPNVAVWLIDGYEPTAAAVGVLGSVKGGATAYPMDPFMGYMHTAIGTNISKFLLGDETPKQALADATKSYTTAATEAGYLK